MAALHYLYPKTDWDSFLCQLVIMNMAYNYLIANPSADPNDCMDFANLFFQNMWSQTVVSPSF